MKNMMIKIVFNKNDYSIIKLDKKSNVKRIKQYLKRKFNIKNKFFLTHEKKILDESEIIDKKKFKRIAIIELNILNRRNKAGLSRSNKIILKTVALFFKYFLRVDFQFFDSILNTIKYSNQTLYQLVLKKKTSFINEIFSVNDKNIEKFQFNENIHKFLDSFKKIFFSKDKDSYLKKYLDKKLSSETSRNISSLYFNENNSKSSNFSKNSNIYNNNSPNLINQSEEMMIQRSIDFIVIKNDYKFLENDFSKKINNFVKI